VIVLDANILLYAYDEISGPSFQGSCLARAGFLWRGTDRIPYSSIAAFLRIATNPKLSGQRFSVSEAAQVVDRWAEHPNARFLSPDDDRWPLFRQMIMDGQAHGALVSDAHLSALTMECGGILHTTDRDFTRFPGLRWTNPLA
jgi:toxin-antitoxin system PIN domain toxin